ncbi:hypothetical protein FGB62_21g43 [Gracilaria domingensis]|nr:hypothetical protein FGB62_21g43 [Gracilaria domingensis]
MQPGDSSNPEPGERRERNFGAIELLNSLVGFPAVTSIESEEYSNLNSFDPVRTSAQNNVKTAEDNSVGICGIGHCKDTKDISAVDKHLPHKEHQRGFTKGPAASVTVTEPTSSPSMFAQESGTEIQSPSAEDKTTVQVVADEEPRFHDSKTVMDRRLQEANDVTGARERSKQKKVKTLSFLEDPSPTGVGDATTRFGTPVNEQDLDLNKTPSSTVRMRGRASKRGNGKSKRSQTPAAPPINMADYGSDDDIAADLGEAAFVQSDTSARNHIAKSGSRSTKSNDARSISNSHERSARHANPTQKLHGRTHRNEERVSTRARVSFELPESSNANVAEPVTKPKCHTPFPRDTIDLLAGSDSEDSDGTPLECRANVSLSKGTRKPTESVQTKSSVMDSQGSLQNVKPFWMPELKAETSDCTNFQTPCPSKKVNFTVKSVRTSSTKTAAPLSTQLAQCISFVRIGAPRNKLTFERATETLNISPSLPSLQRPKLVPGTYCCTCGQNVSHL